MKKRIEKKRRVASLGCHAADPANRSVSAPRAIKELEICKHWLTGARLANCDAPLHAVDIQGLLKILATYHAHCRSRIRGHEDLGIDPRHLYVRYIRDFDGQKPFGRPERVSIKRRTFIAL